MMTVGFFWWAKWIRSLSFDLCQCRVSRGFKRQRTHLEANGLHSICAMGVRGQDSAKGKSLTDWELERSVPSDQALREEVVPWGWGREVSESLVEGIHPLFPQPPHPHMQVPLCEPKLGPDSVAGLCPKPEKSGLFLCCQLVSWGGIEIRIVLHLSPNMNPRTTWKPEKKMPQQGRVTYL